MSEELHKLGDVLRAARESKGLDLSRVERDTKIRTRYLSALEGGEYRDLPGPVYTKGFLRNYGHYLGLDPEYLTDLYRIETDGLLGRPAATVPRPLKARRARALVVTPQGIAAAVLTLGVIALAAYIVYEFMTFARTPQLQVIQPAGDVASLHETQYVISGQTEPNATVTVEGLRENPPVKADAKGKFSVTIKLVPGSNVISLTANDPLTQRDSAKVTRVINVDLGATATPGSGGLTVNGPSNGASVGGSVQIVGTATAGAQVTIQARLIAATAPNFTVTDLNGRAVAVHIPAAGKLVQTQATAASDGAFIGTLSLAPGGAWDLTIATGSPAITVTRRVNVKLAAGLTGLLQVNGSPSYIELLQDNVPVSSVYGRVVKPPRVVSLTAKRTVGVRAGNAGAVSLIINGVALGAMGGPGEVIGWSIVVSR